MRKIISILIFLILFPSVLSFADYRDIISSCVNSTANTCSANAGNVYCSRIVDKNTNTMNLVVDKNNRIMGDEIYFNLNDTYYLSLNTSTYYFAAHVSGYDQYKPDDIYIYFCFNSDCEKVSQLENQNPSFVASGSIVQSKAMNTIQNGLIKTNNIKLVVNSSNYTNSYSCDGDSSVYGYRIQEITMTFNFNYTSDYINQNKLPYFTIDYNSTVCKNSDSPYSEIAYINLEAEDTENDTIYYSLQFESTQLTTFLYKHFEKPTFLGTVADYEYKNASWFISNCLYNGLDIPFYNENEVYLRDTPYFPQLSYQLYLDSVKCNAPTGQGEFMYFPLSSYAYENHYININFFLENGNMLNVIGAGSDKVFNITLNHTADNKMQIIVNNTYLVNYSLTTAYDIYNLQINVSVIDGTYNFMFSDVRAGNNILAYPFTQEYVSEDFFTNATFTRGVIFNWFLQNNSFGIDSIYIIGYEDTPPQWLSYSSYNGNVSFGNLGVYKMNLDTSDNIHLLGSDIYNRTELFFTVVSCENKLEGGLNSLEDKSYSNAFASLKASMTGLCLGMDNSGILMQKISFCTALIVLYSTISFILSIVIWKIFNKLVVGIFAFITIDLCGWLFLPYSTTYGIFLAVGWAIAGGIMISRIGTGGGISDE